MIRRLLAAVATAAVLVALAPPGRAAAHAGLDFSVPSANSVLESGPPVILLDFDESIDLTLTSIQLFDSQEASIAVGEPTQATDDSTVQVAVPTLADGTFVVVWRVSSEDGHVVDGAFSFQVGTGGQADASDLIARVSGGASATAAVDWAYGVARFLALVGIMVLIGAALFGVAGSQAEVPRSTTVVLRAALVALLAGTLGSIGLYGAKAVAGDLGDAFSPDVWGKISDTHVARTLVVRLAFAVGMAVLLIMIRYRHAGWWQGAGLAALVLSVVTFSASGHAYAQKSALPWMANDAIHLGAAGLWFGGLIVFAMGGRMWFTDPDREQTVRRFSAVSTVAIPVVVVTGALQTLKLSGGYDAVRNHFTDTDWGRTLLVKIVVVAVVVSVGAVSHWLVRHEGVHGLRRTVIAEAVIGLAAIGLAAGLVTLPPERAAAAKTFSATLAEGDVLADVTVTPGGVGANEIHIVVTPAGGNLAPVTDLTARVTPVNGSLPTSPVTITEEGTNHYTGLITLPADGDWLLEIVVLVDSTRSVLLSATVPIPG
jgi:copper transport protein